jgi:hypothetical protein
MGLMDWFKPGLKASVTEKKKDVSKVGGAAEPGNREPPLGDEFKAYIPNFLYKPPFGYPLRKNVLMLKELARNPYIFSVIRTLKDEAACSKWEIRLKKEFANEVFSGEHDDEIKRISQFFYNPNGNDESFGDIVAQWVQDLCEVDAAVGVKVFNKKKDFSQLFARDGGSFLKNPNIYGYMGERADFIDAIGDFNPNTAMPDKVKVYSAHYGESAAYFQYGWTGNALPVPFGKREIVYIMSNPRSDSVYGRSPLEIIQDILMTLVYGARYNLDYYLNGNMPDGILNLVGADEDVTKAFQARLKEKFTSRDTLGNDSRVGHVYPVWGGPEVNFVPFQINARDMEIIEQQKWFTKLVWSAFGVTPDEMGYTEDSNKAVSQTQAGVHKRKALKPLLTRIEYAVNNSLMPELDPSGLFEFKWEDYDLDEDLKRHQLYEIQIRNGIKTALMVAEEEGINVEQLKKEKEESKQEQLEMQQQGQGDDNDDDDDDGFFGFDKSPGVKHKYKRRWREGNEWRYEYDEPRSDTNKYSKELDKANKEVKKDFPNKDFKIDKVKETSDGTVYARFVSGDTSIYKILKEGKPKKVEKVTKPDFSSYGTSELISYIADNSNKKFSDLESYGDSELIEEAEKIYSKSSLKHKYIKREGRPGNYTYYYDEPRSDKSPRVVESREELGVKTDDFFKDVMSFDDFFNEERSGNSWFKLDESLGFRDKEGKTPEGGDWTKNKIKRNLLFIESQGDKVAKEVKKMQTVFTYETPAEVIKQSRRCSHFLHELGAGVYSDTDPKIRTEMIEAVKDMMGGDVKETNKALKFMGFKERVTLKGLKQDAQRRTVEEIKADLKTVEYKGISYELSPNYVKNSKSFKSEAELTQSFKEAIDLLPSKVKDLINSGGTKVHFITSPEAKKILGIGSERALGYYMPNNRQIFIFPDKNVYKEFNINRSKMKEEGYDDDFIDKFKVNTGKDSWKHTLVHELSHAAALNSKIEKPKEGVGRLSDKPQSDTVQHKYDLFKLSAEMTKIQWEFSKFVDDNFSYSEGKSGMANKEKHITDYARTNSKEDFAESFAFYSSRKEIIDKAIDDGVKWLNPVLREKFKWLRDNLW